MKCVNIAIAALAGAAVGASLALLFAPDKGENTRAQIRKYLRSKGIAAKGKMDEMVDEIEEQVNALKS